MAEPRSMIAPPRQPLGWPTHRFQHSLKTVMPSRSTGAGMTLHKNIKPELLPSSRYDKLPKRWRGQTIQLQTNYNSQFEAEEMGYSRHAASRPGSENGKQADNGEKGQSRESNTRSAHLEIRPPSAYSASIVLRRENQSDWTIGHSLDAARLRGHMRAHTYLPGNFCTLYRPSLERVKDMVSRLNYDPWERREQLVLTDNPEGDAEVALYSKAEIKAMVDRLAARREEPVSEPEPDKKPPSKELSAKEKEIVDRLTKSDPPADKVKEEEPEEKKTVTAAELEEILKRLTKVPEPKGEATEEEPVKKVSADEMESILTRLTTFDATKWPPESKPQIYKLHAKE